MSVSATYKRGFTLIELLVVIAIIGLLAAVVLASVGSARTKGADAAVKAALDQTRSQAELYAGGNNNSYANVCIRTAAQNGLAAILANAASSSPKATGVTTYPNVTSTGAVQTTNVVCADGSSSWVVSAPLSTTGQYWCADNTGVSKAEANALPSGSSACQ